MSKYLIFKRMAFGFFLSVGSLSLIAQSSATADSLSKRSIFGLFKKGEISKLTLYADFDSIKANVRNKDYVHGKFEVEHSRKQSTSLLVKLRPRGKSRRIMCDFPPLKLKFDKDNLGENGFEHFNDFKLVSHCLDDDLRSEVNIKREYLVYQLFNQLTPFSFNAALVNITYRNSGSSFKKSTHIGIIIEDAECLAHRNNCEVLANKVINLDSLHANHEKIAAVFQYMIGNADWSYLMGRNTELIKMSDSQIVPVPYDFDYAGLVSAGYARANAALGQRTVLDRVYLGNATTYADLLSIFGYFKTKKKELLDTIDEFGELDYQVRLEMKSYLLGFYELIESQERVENEMLSRVKKE